MQLLKHKENQIGKDYVVGDIHGHYTLLMRELQELGFNFKKDRLFSLGDLVDRGPENYRCLQLIDEPWFYGIRGNHDQMMIDWVLSNGEVYPAYLNSYGEWLEKECLDMGEVDRLAKKMQQICPVAREVKGNSGTRYGLVHAEVPGGDWNNIEHDARFGFECDVRQWGRGQVTRDVNYGGKYSKDTKNIDIVYLGHTPMKQSPVKYRNRIYLDTAVWVTSRLNVVQLV